MRPILPRLIAAFAAALLVGCSTLDHSAPPTLAGNARWAVLPFANNTETPLAAGRAETIAESLLLANGLKQVQRYPAELAQETLFEPGARQQAAGLDWARKEGFRYALSGSVDEWRYKVGVDGEPAVGVTLSIVDVANGQTLWSGNGGKSGWSREALAAVARQLMGKLLRAGLADLRN